MLRYVKEYAKDIMCKAGPQKAAIFDPSLVVVQVTNTGNRKRAMKVTFSVE